MPITSNGLMTAPFQNSEGSMFTTVPEREFGAWAVVSGTQLGLSTTWYGLIDLSDTTNFPHEATDHFIISFLRLSIDKTISTRGSIALGIITRIDGTDADIVVIGHGNFNENDTSSIELLTSMAPHQIKTIIVNERLSTFKTNGVLLNQSAINTGILLPPYNFTPAVGDAIIRLTTTAGDGNLSFVVAANYHTK